MMRRIFLLISCFLAFCLASAQPCLPNGITFATQAEVDNFPILYPGCQEILGDVFINEISGSITDLSPLDSIRKIHGNLAIANLPLIDSLTAFPNLRVVGKGLYFGSHIYVMLSPVYINGFDKLDSVYGNFRIEGNHRLKGIEGFTNLKYIGGHFEVADNPSLQKFAVCQELEEIGSYFAMFLNDSLEQISRLQNLHSLGDGFHLSNNAILKSGDILNPSVNISDGIYLFDNPKMQFLPQLHSVKYLDGHLWLENLDIKDLSGLDSISMIRGDLIISGNNQLRNLTALGKLDTVKGSMKLQSCPKVKYLSGLYSLSSVKYDLIIGNMERLTSFGGLQSLKEVNYLKLSELPEVKALSGFAKLEQIYEGLWIDYLPEIQNLNGIENVESKLHSIRIRNNDKLNSLSGMEDWDLQSIWDFSIKNNPSLSYCAIESICAIMWINTNIWFQNNASGCNSVNEVQQECIDLGLEIEEIGQERGFYPNPISQGETLYSAQPLLNARVSLYNADGRRVSEMSNVSGNEIVINTGNLIPGLYILEIKENNAIKRMKLLVSAN